MQHEDAQTQTQTHTPLRAHECARKQEHEREDEQACEQAQEQQPVVALERVSVSFGEVHALSDITLKIYKGEYLSLIHI